MSIIVKKYLRASIAHYNSLNFLEDMKSATTTNLYFSHRFPLSIISEVTWKDFYVRMSCVRYLCFALLFKWHLTMRSISFLIQYSVFLYSSTLGKGSKLDKLLIILYTTKYKVIDGTDCVNQPLLLINVQNDFDNLVHYYPFHFSY